MMVRPAHFGFNEETAANNAFQSNDSSLGHAEIQAAAVKEFDAFVGVLLDHGIEVLVVEDSADPEKPDAIFPNNWISTHQSGVLITYPMFSQVRRLERRPAIIDQLVDSFEVQATFDFAHYEDDERYLEGTGSMIFDRPNKLVYACHSPRTDSGILDQFCRLMAYRKVLFNAVDENGQDIYHTNVMMAMGDQFVVICLDSIRDLREREMVLHQFERTQKEVISITFAQMNAFAGNMLQVSNTSGEPFLVMSEQAYRSLSPAQIRQIENYCHILYSPINTIEKYGGGSVRCMMAELFLKKR